MRQVQTILTEEVLEELKKESGMNTVKDALLKAIDHYLACPYTNEDTMKRRLEDMMKRRKG